MLIVNAQGNYNQGRGADGLHGGIATLYARSRFGAGVPLSTRPQAISSRRSFAASLDPTLIGARELDNMRLPFAKPLTLARRMSPPPGKRPPTKAATIRQRRQFVKWLQNWAPQVYAAAKKKADQVEVSEGTLGQLAGWWETFSTSVLDVGGKVLQFKTQKEILDAQMERMRAGLPPLQTSEYAPTIAVKPDAGTTREITGAIGAGFGQLLPWLAIGGLGLFLLMRPKRRR